MFLPPTITFDARGLIKGLRTLPRDFDLEMELCFRRAGRGLAAHARAQHDYTDRSGALTASIHPLAVEGRFSDDEGVWGGVGATMGYAGYVEDGTPRMHQRGGYKFLAGAWSAQRDAIEDAFELAFERALFRRGMT